MQYKNTAACYKFKLLRTLQDRPNGKTETNSHKLLTADVLRIYDCPDAWYLHLTADWEPTAGSIFQCEENILELWNIPKTNLTISYASKNKLHWNFPHSVYLFQCKLITWFLPNGYQILLANKSCKLHLH